ncbi:MAG TPA: hypothetical protein VJ327_10840 [Patescibacteria group bacterium]|nr:hypothetical protein [Patescibacteria group bacterium]
MELKKLEQHSDNSLERLDKAADEHFDGKREDKSAMVQAGLSNATARQIGANLNIRKTKIREALAVA